MGDERREPGRDGVTGLLSHARLVRARWVSRPSADDEAQARTVLPDLLARARGQRR